MTERALTRRLSGDCDVDKLRGIIAGDAVLGVDHKPIRSDRIEARNDNFGVVEVLLCRNVGNAGSALVTVDAINGIVAAADIFGWRPPQYHCRLVYEIDGQVLRR